jgi:hypothetical protein
MGFSDYLGNTICATLPSAPRIRQCWPAHGWAHTFRVYRFASEFTHDTIHPLPLPPSPRQRWGREREWVSRVVCEFQSKPMDAESLGRPVLLTCGAGDGVGAQIWGSNIGTVLLPTWFCKYLC